MASREITVKEIYNNYRIDKYLAEVNKDFSRSYIQQLIGDNFVKVNGKTIKKSYKVKTGDHIFLTINKPKELKLEKKEMDLDIIYEDDQIIVINKPVGLIVHPVKGNKSNTLVNALLAHTDQLGSINGTIRPGIIHRLDKNTSGTIVVAKSQDSLNTLLKQFKAREIKKIYRTIIKGVLPYNSGTIDAPIGRNPKNRTKMAVVKNNSKKAITKFEVIKRFNKYTYLEVDLKTGRTHQIRVHFSDLGYPIIGDEKYGYKQDDLTIEHQLLHAYKIGFYHPESDKWLEFTADIPNEFLKILSEVQ
ncbi:MAG: RluA family pseudouridine synthase [Halanaerobiales bacterium]|nr:RluA family pseudouridine synthase [Halanaerobiales bacterium]